MDTFRHILGANRPRLVQAVEVWAELSAHPTVQGYGHPVLWERERWEPLLEAQRVRENRRRERTGRGGIVLNPLYLPPDRPGRYAEDRKEAAQGMFAFDLLEWLADLGWRWEGPETGMKPKKGQGRGGGPWLPRWWIKNHSPEDVDRLPLDGCTWVVPEGMRKGRHRAGKTVIVRALPLEMVLAPTTDGDRVPIRVMPADPLPGNEGKSLFTATVGALETALELYNRNDGEKREAIAEALPPCFEALSSPAPGGDIANALDNLRKRRKTSGTSSRR